MITMEGKVPWWITVSYNQASGDYICKSLKTEIEVQQRLEEPSVIILNMKNIAAHATTPFMSLRELSQRLASRPDEVGLVARRIRHWTNEKLIETVGDRHSGKGRHRQYSLAGIVTAALLWELSKYNLPVGVLEKILPAIEWIDDHYFEEMELALADSMDGRVFG